MEQVLLFLLVGKESPSKTKNRFKVMSVQLKILFYSNSVQCIKTRAVGDVLMINN